MAIPLPNPNIDDTKKVDNLTWSSNKIAGEVAGAAEALIDDSASSDSTTYSSDKIDSLLEPITDNYQLIQEITTEEETTQIDLEELDLTHVFITMVVTLAANTNGSTSVKIKTPENSTLHNTNSMVYKSFVANQATFINMKVSIDNGLVSGYGNASANGVYGNMNSSNSIEYFENILASKITDLSIISSYTLPVGTNIKVYAY